MATHTIEWFLEQLEGVEGSDGQWLAWCPCHDDFGSSMKGLSVSLSGKRILMKCHSPQCGATLVEVLAQLQQGTNGHSDVKIKHKQKTPAEKKSRGGMAWWCERTQVAKEVWDSLGCVEHEDGVAFLFEGRVAKKIRKPPKEIVWTPRGADAPPFWPMPEEQVPEEVLIAEGESDTGTAAAAGHYVLGVTKGAGTDLPTTWAKVLRDRGARKITICGDIDKAGSEFKRDLEKEVIDAGLECSVVHLEEVLDPFTGETDLNNLWKMCEGNIAAFNALLDSCTHQVSARHETLSYEDLLECAEGDEEWYMVDLIAPGDKIMISGPQKSYKTWIALDLARSLVAGTDFLMRPEWHVPAPQTVLFVQEEGSRAKWAKRIRRLNLEGKERERLHTLHRQGIRFTDPTTIDTLISICRQREITVLFLDPLQRMIPGVDENDSSATGIVWDEVFRLQQALPHLVVCVIHHANKAERLTWESVRGSSRHAGEVDLGIFCQKHPLEDDTVRISYDGRDIPTYLGTGDAFEGKVIISHEGETPQFEIDAREVKTKVNTTQAQQQGQKNRDAVLNAISAGTKTKKGIIEQTGLSDSTVRSHLEALIEDGVIIEEDHGKGRMKTYKESDEQSEH